MLLNSSLMSLIHFWMYSFSFFLWLRIPLTRSARFFWKKGVAIAIAAAIFHMPAAERWVGNRWTETVGGSLANLSWIPKEGYGAFLFTPPPPRTHLLSQNNFPTRKVIIRGGDDSGTNYSPVFPFQRRFKGLLAPKKESWMRPIEWRELFGGGGNCSGGFVRNKKFI